MKSLEIGIFKTTTAMQRCVHLLQTVRKNNRFWTQTEKHKKLRELVHELGKQIVELTAPEPVPTETDVTSFSEGSNISTPTKPSFPSTSSPSRRFDDTE